MNETYANLGNNGNNTKTTEKNDISLFKNFIIIYKALVHKKLENNNIYEELCREILGNESYFLFNLDKLFNSVKIHITSRS
jgi:hypothetical protein